jgi:hypothetical protein
MRIARRARRPVACISGQGRAGGQVKGAAAHPEVARRPEGAGNARWRRIGRRRSSASAGVTATLALLRCSAARLLQHRGGGSRGGAPGELGDARGGLQHRGSAATMAGMLGCACREEEEGTREEGKERGRDGAAGDLIPLEELRQRWLSRPAAAGRWHRAAMALPGDTSQTYL